MQGNNIAGSSKALYAYANELDKYIKDTSANIWHLVAEHREVGNSWNDRLYEDFTSVINSIKNQMITQLEELINLRKSILEKAQILEEIEKTQF